MITPFSGWLSDRLGLWSRRTRAWLGVPCFLILAAVFAAGFYYQIAACCAIGMFLFIIPVTGVHIATQELVPTRYKATAYGTYVTLLQGLGFFGPMLAGALSDAFGLQLALVYMQLVFVIGGLIMLVAGFTYVKDYNRPAPWKPNRILGILLHPPLCSLCRPPTLAQGEHIQWQEVLRRSAARPIRIGKGIIE